MKNKARKVKARAWRGLFVVYKSTTNPSFRLFHLGKVARPHLSFIGVWVGGASFGFSLGSGLIGLLPFGTKVLIVYSLVFNPPLCVLSERLMNKSLSSSTNKNHFSSQKLKWFLNSLDLETTTHSTFPRTKPKIEI